MTRSTTKLLEIIDPRNKIVFAQLEREPRRRRRRCSEPGLVSVPVQPPGRRQRRTKTLGAPSVWCYCGTPDDGTLMVRCGRLRCRVKWFHVRCLEESVNLLENWLCRTCRQ